MQSADQQTIKDFKKNYIHIKGKPFFPSSSGNNHVKLTYELEGQMMLHLSLSLSLSVALT